MKTYQYQILRFLPNRINGEFVNLGIVVFDPEEQVIKGKFLTKLSRITAIFPSVSMKYLTRVLKHFQWKIDQVSMGRSMELRFNDYKSIDEITKLLIPKDDSALSFTVVNNSLDLNIDAVMTYLYNKIIGHHESEEVSDSLNDKEVWSKVYKEFFDSYGISSHLHSHVIETSSDRLEFDKAWKNGKWNCFEPVSFDLARVDSIKNKVYRWVGKIDELKTSKEPMHLYLLSVFPDDDVELKKFITEKLGRVNIDNAEVDLVTKDNVVQIANKIKGEIERHESGIH